MNPFLWAATVDQKQLDRYRYLMLKVIISGTDKLVIRMAGKINEAADLQLVNVPKAASIEVDLIDVTHINSVGIRQFRDWAMTLNTPVIWFSYCPRVFIDQVNMIDNFIPKHSRFMSFYVPYFSENTGEEKKVLFVHGEHFENKGGEVRMMWPVVTDSAGQGMELDVLPEKYFQFLSRY